VIPSILVDPRNPDLVLVAAEGNLVAKRTPAAAAEPVHLFKPDATVRTRRNTNFDTPFPPEVPHALNPPDGVIIFYSLDSKPSGEITFDVLDLAGTNLRHMSSVPGEPVTEASRPPHPNFWVAPRSRSRRPSV
jgi:hypothetical protein